jgi:hypothetical protein
VRFITELSLSTGGEAVLSLSVQSANLFVLGQKDQKIQRLLLLPYLKTLLGPALIHVYLWVMKASKSFSPEVLANVPE